MFEKLVKFYFFIDKSMDSFFRSWIISSIIIFILTLFDKNFDIYASIFISMFIGIFFTFILLPILFLIHLILEFIIDFYCNKDDEKNKIFLHYYKIRLDEIEKETKKLKKELDKNCCNVSIRIRFN